MENISLKNKKFSNLSSRRSVLAKFISDPGPSDSELNEILSIGIRVPDHGICSPWRIQVINKKGQKKLGKKYASVFLENNPEATSDQIEYWKMRPQSAPILLVISFYPKKEKIDKIPINEQLLSCGALCQNIINASFTLGYVSQWLTEWPAYNDSIKRFLGHKELNKILGFIFIGSSTEKPKERRRPEVKEVVTEWE